MALVTRTEASADNNNCLVQFTFDNVSGILQTVTCIDQSALPMRVLVTRVSDGATADHTFAAGITENFDVRAFGLIIPPPGTPEGFNVEIRWPATSAPRPFLGGPLPL